MGELWTEQRIRRELETFLPGHDEWPTYTQFRAAGRRELWEAITRPGGPAAWAQEYSLAYRFKRRAWSDAEIRDRLRAVLRGSDVSAWPPARWLAARGGQRLVSAVNRTGGPARCARELGLPLRDPAGGRLNASTRHSSRCWRTGRRGRAAASSSRRGGVACTRRSRHGEGHPALAERYGLRLQHPARHRAAPAAGRSRGEQPGG